LGVGAAREPSDKERPSTLTALASEPAEVRNAPRRDEDLDPDGCEISRADAQLLAALDVPLAGAAPAAAVALRSALSSRSAAAISPLLVPPAVLAPGRQPIRESVVLHVCAGGPPLTPPRLLPAPRVTRHAPPPPPPPPPPPAEAGAGAALSSALSLKLRCGPSESHTPGPQLILRCWLVLVHDRSSGPAPTPGPQLVLRWLVFVHDRAGGGSAGLVRVGQPPPSQPSSSAGVGAMALSLCRIAATPDSSCSTWLG